MLDYTTKKKEIKTWLKKAFSAASAFDGSEASEKKFYQPLQLFDDFVRAHNQGKSSSDLEQRVTQIAFPDHPIEMPETVDGFLDIVSSFYERLKSYENSTDIFDALKESGAAVKESDKVFVQTGDGQINKGISDDPNSFEVITQPRLAMLIAHLRNEGVNGQSIYMDDLVVIPGKNDPNMVRELPYNIVQIPRLDMEIALCDQVGEITFVKKGTIGETFWEHMIKDDLKERDDIWTVRFNDEDQWWNGISKVLSGNAEPTANKVNVKGWGNKPSKLDIELVKTSLLVHRLRTGKWLKPGTKKTPESPIGSYVIKHGPLTDYNIKAGALNAALRNGLRGLPIGLSIAQLNEEIAQEHSLDYKNPHNQEGLDIEDVKASLLEHRLSIGEWLSQAKKETPEDTSGSYIIKHGPLASKNIRVSALSNALIAGHRGLEGGASIAKLNEKISQEHDYLIYLHPNKKKSLNIEDVKASLLAHRKETGWWLSNGSKETPEDTQGSYVIKHGPFADESMKSGSLDGLLQNGLRGLPIGLSIAQLNEKISQEHSLDYRNTHNLKNLNIEDVKVSLLAHKLITGKWLSGGAIKQTSKSSLGNYIIEHGPLAEEKIKSKTLDSNLRDGSRGLPKGSSIAREYDTIAQEIGIVLDNSKERVSALGVALDTLREDLDIVFKGDEVKVIGYIDSLKLEDYYKLIKFRLFEYKGITHESHTDFDPAIT